ncbi:2,5-diketo-D-gluconic acid reductase B [archaeon HR01]|nr:2,5-diketo-D-gluconic acid reductase B [archaeon HR01]
MERRRLGRKGEEIPVIGLGTWGIGGYSTADHSSDGRAVEAIRYAVELGMTHIDTAEIYGAGHSEELVGQAIRVFDRDSLFIATKVWNTHLRYDDVIRSCRRSLERLGLRYVDLYMVHWPNPRIPLSETMRAMEKLVKDGLTRYIGVSNFDARLLGEAMQALKSEEIVSNQVEYSLSSRYVERELIPFCERNGVTVVAYTPLGRGRIVDEAHRGTVRGRVLAEIAGRYGRTPAQIALNWVVWREGVVTIPKAASRRHLEENAGAAGWRLSLEDYRRLSDAWS